MAMEGMAKSFGAANISTCVQYDTNWFTDSVVSYLPVFFISQTTILLIKMTKNYPTKDYRKVINNVNIINTIIITTVWSHFTIIDAFAISITIIIVSPNTAKASHIFMVTMSPAIGKHIRSLKAPY